jgi:hypothetical protein
MDDKMTRVIGAEFGSVTGMLALISRSGLKPAVIVLRWKLESADVVTVARPVAVAEASARPRFVNWSVDDVQVSMMMALA